MKVVVIDKNNIDAFVSLEDGSIASVPLNMVSSSNIGDILHMSKENIICSHNTSNPSSMVLNSLVDFF